MGLLLESLQILENWKYLAIIISKSTLDRNGDAWQGSIIF